MDVTRETLARGTAALLPFVQEWDLALNPENLELMAGAVIRFADSEASYAEIDSTIRQWIAENQSEHEDTTASMQDASTGSDADDSGITAG